MKDRSVSVFLVASAIVTATVLDLGPSVGIHESEASPEAPQAPAPDAGTPPANGGKPADGKPAQNDAPPPAPKPSGGSGDASCPFEVTDTAYGAARTKLGLDGKTKLTHSRVIADHAYVIVGPDGKLLGAPTHVREDSDITVVVYRPKPAARYGLAVDGCQAVPVRYLNAAKQPEQTEPVAGATVIADDADVYEIGQCSASSALTFHVTVSPDVGCDAGERTFSLTTDKVYTLVAAIAGAFYIGETQTVGVDVGAGGQASRAYQRDKLADPAGRLGVFWFPGGYSDSERWSSEDIGTSFKHKLAVGVLVDVSKPLDDLNIIGGLEITNGITLFAGIDICRQTKSLAGGLKNGDVYTEDADKLPTTDSFTCKEPRAVLGISITATALAGVLAK